MRQELNTKSKLQVVIIILLVALCVCSLFPHLATSDTKSTKYPLQWPALYYNAYVQQFDAFMKGQLNIDYEPTEELLNLENPYDWEQRREGDIGYYLWDRALYDGQYFSYFGIAPIITIFFPSYFLTGAIPSPSVTCAILAVIGMVALCIALINLIKYFKIKVPFYLFCISLVAVEMGSLLPMLMSSADMYYIAATSAVAYFSLFIALFFSGMNAKKQSKKNLLFALSSIAFVLVIMSRPGVALLGLFIAPVLIKYFFKTELTKKQQLKSLFAFAIPLIIGAIIVCTYNYLRFDSIFEFGAKYQLTVYDVSQYEFSLSLLFPAIYHYFFQAPTRISTFPFIKLSYINLRMHTTPYLYNTATIGAFAFLSNLGFFGLGGVLVKPNQKHTAQKWVYVLAFSSIAVLAFFNTCMGGINIRYFADFQFVMCLFTALILLEIPSFFKDSKKLLQMIVSLIIIVLFICTAILGFLLIFENERNYILSALIK